MSQATVTTIDEAIDSYAVKAGAGTGAAPYDAASLAEIYGERVQQLFRLQRAGFTHARWGWDDAVGYNHWHGVS